MQFLFKGLRLLGFKPFDCIKPYMHIKPGHFLYPDEKVCFYFIKNIS